MSEATVGKRLRKGAEIEFVVEKFADRGKTVSRIDDFVVFLSGSAPGDRVRAKIIKRKKKFAEARLLELLEPSPMRTDPTCRFFGTCGGCKWQHVKYEHQLEAKQQAVEEALRNVEGISNVQVRPTIGSEKTFWYRNKMEFSFSAHRWLTPQEIASKDDFDRTFALGLHAPGSYQKVLDLDVCYLQSETSVNIVNALRVLSVANGWEPWNVRDHTGYLRHLVIRSSEDSGEHLVNLVTNGYNEDRIRMVADTLRDIANVTSLVNTINTGVAQTSYGEETKVIFGPGRIVEKIGSYSFGLAPNAFFQTNTTQAERLYEVVREFAGLQGKEVVYDLFSGAGSISIYLSGECERVVGIEVIENAVMDARENAIQNGVENCEFVLGDVLKVFDEEFVEKHGTPDVLITDPPRAGMHPKVARRLAAFGPPKIVYVSCNPQTQAMDLKALVETYDIEAVQPVDMFPHTHHIENVVLLKRR